MGSLEQAKDYYEQALRIWKTQLGPNHVLVATCNRNLGTVCLRLMNFNRPLPVNYNPLIIINKRLKFRKCS